MKLRKFLGKYGSSMMALALTAMAAEFATRGCFYFAYQPKAPEGLKKFSKNK